MVKANRTRPVQVRFRLTEKEKKLLDKKLVNSEFSNMEAFVRKLVLTGYVINLDLKSINKLVTISSYLSNNLNQLAKRANSYEVITNEDIQSLRKSIEHFNASTKLLLDEVGEL